MQLFRVLWIAATFAATLVLARNFHKSAAVGNQLADKRRPAMTKQSVLQMGFDRPQPHEPPSALLAFVGVFTSSKSARRQALRRTWFPSCEEDLIK